MRTLRSSPYRQPLPFMTSRIAGKREKTVATGVPVFDRSSVQGAWILR
jgi:hypothetical protein